MSTGTLQPAFGARTPIENAAQELLARIATVKAVGAANIFTRLEVSIESADFPCDFLNWLRSAPSGERRYFRNRSAKFEIAGVGKCLACKFGEHEKFDQHVGDSDIASQSVWFVALPFNANCALDSAWDPYRNIGCVLPEIELRRDGQALTLAVNLSANTSFDALRQRLHALAAPVKKCAIDPALVRQTDEFGESKWTQVVQSGLQKIRSGSLRKIVLARARTYAASSPLDPVAVLARLCAFESSGFRFLIEAGQGKAFLGVTPERLLSRTGRLVRSEAIAGTRPRGVDEVADRLLGESLLASDKDRREHEFVVERLREVLSGLSVSLRVDAEPRILRQAYVQHLATRVQAEIRADFSDADLVALLHPTPAVSGAPVPCAIKALGELETIGRGLYAGPVGIVSRDKAEIAVAIRCARIDGATLKAYAGAGIVEGSIAADEWRETVHKLLAFERLAT